MYREHRVRYYFPSEMPQGWKGWLWRKVVYGSAGYVTLLGFTVEWQDYHFA